MTDRPIIFSGPMVRALLDGRKSMTRRVLKKTQAQAINRGFDKASLRLPYAPGDRLYVREGLRFDGDGDLVYSADNAPVEHSKIPEEWPATRASVPAIFCPRWASRLTLTVTGVRVQRLQEISEEDARSEGIDDRDAVCGFSEVWDTLHGPDAWDANPWVVALTFTVEKRNIDEVTQ